MRALYREECNCQIIHDSSLSRGLADPYLILHNGRLAGYGGVWNKYYPGRLMEFYILPHLRGAALPMFRALVEASGATQIEAQTNIPLMLLMLFDCASNIAAENVLFYDAHTTSLACQDAAFRRTSPEDTASIPQQDREPIGDWLLEARGAIVATGGFLCHYNPPYGDIYMEVAESARRQGYGSFLVQELKRVCYEAGKRPAARCNATNIASRRTLERAGMLPCGRLLVGDAKRTAEND